MKSLKALKNQSVDVSRRQFLLGSVGGSLMMAFAPTVLALAGEAQKSLTDKAFSPTIWFEINASGTVLVNIAKAEMGQHVGTALARIVAEELGADWNTVEIKHVDTDPKWGYMVTGGSWSIFTSYKPLSQAGAAGRIALIEAGAKILKVSPADCEAKGGYVISSKGKISFAELVQKVEFNKQFSAEELAALPLKTKSKHTLHGNDFKALDIPAKTNGTAKYGIDVEIEGMVYARPILPPTRYGSKVLSVDDSKAKALEDYLGFEILKDPSETLQGWVSVLAKDYPTAIKAADLLTVKYQAGPTARSMKRLFCERENVR